MANIVVVNWMTLDGVTQGPGRPGEDESDGFQSSGWAQGYTDDVVSRQIGAVMSGTHHYLFGHRSYDVMLESWNEQGGPFRDALNRTRKYVASTNDSAHLAWPNSTLLSGDVTEAVADLKANSEHDLVIMGSSRLIGSLIPSRLIDEYLLVIAPLVLGEGRKLFPSGAAATLRLVDSVPASTGALVARFTSA